MTQLYRISWALRHVVNCFHFWVSLRYDTTKLITSTSFPVLWIAFIFEYLWDMTQRWIYILHNGVCCELLSFLSIFEIWHNFRPFNYFRLRVVNCFHFWVSLRYDTTLRHIFGIPWWLWIAFIFEYLWDMTQPPSRISGKGRCCELLSFLSIFEIWHNSWSIYRYWWRVVNCFHFWVSLRYDTTSLRLSSFTL